MNKFKKFAIQIFSYGISPVLMSGNELPGAPKSKKEPVGSIWVPMNKDDFSVFADTIENKKQIASTREDWLAIGNQLTQLLDEESFNETCRLKLLINLAFVSYKNKSRTWFNVCVKEANELVENRNIYNKEALASRVQSLNELRW